MQYEEDSEEDLLDVPLLIGLSPSGVKLQCDKVTNSEELALPDWERSLQANMGTYIQRGERSCTAHSSSLVIVLQFEAKSLQPLRSLSFILVYTFRLRRVPPDHLGPTSAVPL